MSCAELQEHRGGSGYLCPEQGGFQGFPRGADFPEDRDLTRRRVNYRLGCGEWCLSPGQRLEPGGGSWSTKCDVGSVRREVEAGEADGMKV